MNYSHLLHQLHSCAERHTPSPAKTLHAQIIKSGLQHCEPLLNTLIDVYGKCSLLRDAAQVFGEMPHRGLVSWASFLTAHNQSNCSGFALSVFPRMLGVDRLRPDHFVIASLVKGCSNLGALRQGRQVHAHFVKSAYYEDDIVKSSLVDMYAKCGVPSSAWSVFGSIYKKNSLSWTAMISGFARSGQKSDALELFERMPEKNLFSWTALISGLAQSGDVIEAFGLFLRMRRNQVDIVDPFVLSSIVGASSSLAALDLGKQIHCLVMVLGFQSCLFVSNALVDMYAKCSDIIAAVGIFDGMTLKDVVSWTSIIVGMAQHGKAEEALSMYDKMISAGLKPNEVTFVGLIYACSHVGLLTKGRSLFDSMIKDYGISPSLQHYTCFLDLLSRSGHLDEAENVIKSMPFKPDEPTWAAFLSACRRHGNAQMAIRVSDHLMSQKLEDPSTYILLSNAYASASMWESVSKVRKLMAQMEFRKRPGYSSINLGRDSQVFFAGEACHPMKDEMFGLLKEIEAEMKRRGYVPDTSSVLHDLEPQEKERLLFWHSERLAVAYGLLKSVPETVIRIVKNLRVCGDCHTVLKFISSIAKRDIVVRDANRFHHFKDGSCSCHDFW